MNTRYSMNRQGAGVNLECSMWPIHTQKSFRNLIKSYRNQIVFTIFRLIWNQTNVHLAPNQSKNGTYNLILVCFNKIPKRFLCFNCLLIFDNSKPHYNQRFCYFLELSSHLFIVCFDSWLVFILQFKFRKSLFTVFPQYSGAIWGGPGWPWPPLTRLWPPLNFLAPCAGVAKNLYIFWK